MKTLFVAYRVTDLDPSLDFYTAPGLRRAGQVEGGDGSHLVILKFPGEQPSRPEAASRPHPQA